MYEHDKVREALLLAARHFADRPERAVALIDRQCEMLGIGPTGEPWDPCKECVAGGPECDTCCHAYYSHRRT